MDFYEKRDALKKLVSGEDPVIRGNLHEMLYSFNELGVFGDFELDIDTVFTAWHMIEYLRTNEFPEELTV